jgi:hypothetical protein
LHPVTREDGSMRHAYAAKIRKFRSAQLSLPRSSCFGLRQDSNRSALARYHAIVVGSDEVWNLSHPWYGSEPLFYGHGIDRPLIAYAASFGSFDASWPFDDWHCDRLAHFKRISVRDSNSRLVVLRATGVPPPIVLDPCLLQDPAEEGTAGGYLLLYGHDFSTKFADHVKRFAKERGLEVVSIGYGNSWADRQWIDASPWEWDRAFAGATAVATNFFHGCAFSIRYRKPFAAECMPYRSIKVRDLLAQLGASGRIVTPRTEAADFERHLLSAPDGRVFENLECLRERSWEFLKHALT